MEQIKLAGDFLCAWKKNDGTNPGKEAFQDIITLPQTTETAKIGEFHREDGQTMYLSRNYPIAGTVFYKRLITIPKSWEGKRIELVIERTKKSSVYMDGMLLSTSKEMVTPAKHQLGVLSSGTHELMIAVDNDLSKEWFPKQLLEGHQFSEHTQTNWNGVLGEMFLRTKEETDITYLKAVKQKNSKLIEITLEIDSELNKKALVCVTLKEKEGQEIGSCMQEAVLRKGEKNTLTITLEPACKIKGWDEFTKVLYTIHAQITGLDGRILGEKTIQTGFVEAITSGKQIFLNGRCLFLRGNVDCCIFPLTGHPPMEKKEWERIFGIMKAYGMNHYRFHSWCPPEAAFEAADEMGIYLGVEMSLFAAGLYEEEDPEYDSRLMGYLYKEAENILREFGHHPSFLFFAVGNELVGNPKAYEKLVRFMKTIREDKLYTQGANNFLEDPSPNKEDDVWITMRAGKGVNARASYSHNDLPLGHIQEKGRLGTLADYKEGVDRWNVPLIVHEAGQYQFYPDYKEKEKYIGATYSTALAYYEQKLKESGMDGDAAAFYEAAGQLAVLCYEEEVEAFMRTDGLAGFELLGLQDFPGQGTALVGMLDSFLDSKGFISPEKWRNYCSETVLLGKFASYVYQYGDDITIEAVLHHYGQDKAEGGLTITLTVEGDEISCIRSKMCICEPGKNTSLGTWNISTGNRDCKKAARAVLSLEFGKYQKEYPIFLYPEAQPEEPGEILVTEQFTEKEKQAMEEGKTVFLASDHLAQGIEGFFPTDFWCYPMFRDACVASGRKTAPGTMGLLIQKDHPLLADFPTNSYSEWQWQQPVVYSTGYILDDYPGIKPIIQVIDHISRNHRIGLLFEVPCEKGRLIICGIDLLHHLDLPEICQLYNSILNCLKRG